MNCGFHLSCDVFLSELSSEGQWRIGACLSLVEGYKAGGPISPYSFLLCGKGLACMLKSNDGGWIDTGIRVSTSAPWISFLLFDDGCLVFMKSDARSASRLNAVLEK